MSPIRSILFAVIAAAALILTGCGGGNPTVPADPADLVGDWIGSYQNDVVGVGSIEASFFMYYTTLRVTYDLQGGEVTGTSQVAINGREIVFIGVGTKLQQVKGTVNGSSTHINGTLVIDYTLYGVRSGPVQLTKI